MLEILIVEDNLKKLNKIKSILEKSEYYLEENLSVAGTVNQAKDYLRLKKYDLMLLDIQIPKISGQNALAKGGLEVLTALKHPKHKVPNHIIGMTAYDESVELAAIDFDENLFQLIKYDETSDDWEKKLEKKITHIGDSKKSELENDNNFNYDVAIICALEDPELKSILRLSEDWNVVDLHNDDVNTYYTTTFRENDREIKVVATAATQMGMVATATLTTKIISHFKPRYLFMTGITAGVRDKNEYGDVLVVDIAWDYTSGKIVSEDGKEVLQPDPFPLRLSPKLKKIASNIANNEMLLMKIRSNWSGDKPKSVLQVQIGGVASGGAVVESSTIVEGIKKHARKTIGIEMESYAVYYSAENSFEPKPQTMVLKSVCDFADKDKNDNYQKYAAYTSAQVLYHMIVNELDFDND